QYPIQGDENWHLQQHGQTALHRVDLLFLVELDHLLRELLAVVSVAFFQLLHFGAEFAHLRHGSEAGGRQVEEDCFDGNNQQNNGYTPVRSETVEQAEEIENGQADKPQGTVVNGQIQVRSDFQ